MAFDFPANPATGTQQTMPDGTVRVWDGAKWVAGAYAGNAWVPLTGGTMTGPLVLNADPTANLGAATKQYADHYAANIGRSYIHNGLFNIQQRGIGTSVINLATTSGAQHWLGGAYPAAGVLARADWVASHQAVVQKVADALVATMHWINTHSAADIANAMPPAFVSNGLTTKAAYIAELAQDKGQFLADGMMPPSGPATVLAIEKFIGNVTGPVNLSATYAGQYAIAANKLEGFAS